MRLFEGGSLLAAALLAAALPVAARAEDASTIPGGARTGQAMQRPMRDNPEMKPYMSMAPAAATAATTAAAAPQAAPAPVQARQVEPREAVLRDVGQLLHQAEGDVTARRLDQADRELSEAEMSWRNAEMAGDRMPDGVLQSLAEARQGIRQNDLRAAARGTELAQRRVDATH